MHLFYIVFISVANNLDNISVRIAYSFRGISISLQKNLWISFITFIFSSTAAFMGSSISGLLNSRLSSFVSMFLLIVIGIWIIIGNRSKKENSPVEIPDKKNTKNLFIILDKPEYADLDNSKEIDFKEATLLGLALSLDNIGGGISAGLIGFNFIYAGLVSAIISFLALYAGNILARAFNRLNLGSTAQVISGIIIILIGIKQVL